MPKDKAGKFHLTTQQAMGSDKMANMHKQSGDNAKGVGDPVPGGMSDATMSDDSGAAGHLAEMHAEMGGKHMHVHQGDDGSITSHHVGDDGMVQGPHNHENMEALKDHMNHFLDEEKNEAYDDGERKGAEMPAPHHAMSGM